MKRGLAAAFAAGMLALVIVSTPAVSATGSLRGNMVLKLDWNNCAPQPGPLCFWSGTISGDGIPAGTTIEFHEVWDQNYIVGNTGHVPPLGTEHFFETFKITSPGGVATGVDKGIWNLATLKFRASGWVVEASGDLASLQGYKIHEMGFVSVDGSQYTGAAEWFLAGP